MKTPLLLIIAVFFLASCSSSVDKVMPVQQNISESVYASGVVKAKYQYDVFSTTNGILAEVLVKEGDSISAGTPLFRIDNAISELSSDNARLAMDRLKDKSSSGSSTLIDLESRMILAGEKYRNDSVLYVRQQKLWEQNVGSKLELEKRELAYKSSQTEYNSSRLQYELIKSDLEKEYSQSRNNYLITQKQQTDYIIKSKVDGVIYSIDKEPGEFVSTITPVAVVGDAGSFELELQVDEFDIVKIKSGQKVFVSMDSYRGQVFQAVISRIEPYMNQRTRTFNVWADFVAPPEVLYPNLSVEVNILISQKDNAITIPAVFLIGENMVLTSPKDTTIVQIGISNLQWVEILSGLNIDQEVYKPSR